jgi:hypothetical protein
MNDEHTRARFETLTLPLMSDASEVHCLGVYSPLLIAR